MATVKLEFPMPDNEACSAPYWMILDPGKPNGAMSDDGLSDADLARMVAGPFFSRDEARDFLDANRHNFTAKAVVWSLFGRSRLYQKAWRRADEETDHA